MSTRGDFARGLAVAIVVMASLATLSRATQAASVSGTVRDSSSGTAVEAASIFLRSPAGTEVARGVTGSQGEFALEGVLPGQYVLSVTHPGYEPVRVPGIVLAEADERQLDVTMIPTAILLNPVVITASRRPEHVLDSPAPTTVVTRRILEERAALHPSNHLNGVPGVQVTSPSLGRDAVSIRGLGTMMSRDLLLLADHRLAGLATPRVAMMEFGTADDDLDRIEVVRGPGAALYGPNADRGLVHMVSKSPFEYPGTTVRIGAGEREVGLGSIRHAQVLGSSWAYRVSGRYFRGLEWPYTDPVEAARRSAAIAAGADPETLKVGYREPVAERYSLDARADWRAQDRTSVALAGGYGNDARVLGTSDAGALQLDSWEHGYAQVRVNRNRLFAQLYANGTRSGDSYFIRNGAPIINKSQLFAGQIQHGARVGEGLELLYGLDGKRTNPRTERSLHGRYEDDDTIDEVGGYLHSEVRLLDRLRGIAALRVDHNDRIEDPVLSPRAALLYRAGTRQNLRATYNRAYGTPDASDYFFDSVLDSLPVPMAVRAAGTPATGFTYRRDANGPMIRSPFTPPALGGPMAFLTGDVTPFWPVIVAIMQAQGVDLSGVPAPTASDVSTSLFLVNPQAGTAEQVTSVQDIERLRPTITNSVELGYQGQVADRWRLEGSLYHTWVEDFVGRFRNITPNAFLDFATLQAYLIANGVPPAQAASYAAQIARIPLGTVSPEQAFDPADILLASRNFGTIRFWGADGSVAVRLAEPLSLLGTISWVSQEFFTDLDGVDDVALNAPGLSGTLSMQYRDLGRVWSATARLRIAESYPFQSGIYSGEIDGYALLDLGLVYRPRAVSGMAFILTADNVLDDRHLEFVGASEIGRVALFQIRQEF